MQDVSEPVRKAVRLLYIFRRLEVGARLTKRELAAQCGVSVRTIERDLLDLQGAPLYTPLLQEGGRWQYMGCAGAHERVD